MRIIRGCFILAMDLSLFNGHLCPMVLEQCGCVHPEGTVVVVRSQQPLPHSLSCFGLIKNEGSAGMWKNHSSILTTEYGHDPSSLVDAFEGTLDSTSYKLIAMRAMH